MRLSPQKKLKKKIFLVDDHPAMRQGLKELIHQEEDLLVCGEAGDIFSAMEGILKIKPDIVIIDLTLGQTSGLDLVKDLRVRVPGLLMLVLSMHHEALYAERCIRAGARGYIMKEATTENIIVAIRKILSGDVYLSSDIASNILKKIAGAKGDTDPIESLSDRELEVYRLIGEGLRTRDIAGRLHLSVKTIESYREHLKVKLQLANAAQLTRSAVEWAQRRQ